MKRLARITGLKICTMLLLAGSILGSCNVLDDEATEDCAVYVSFKYDMNMEFTNSFAHAVNSVTLYAFDESGKLAFQKTEEGELLKQNDYRMRLDEISVTERANYDFIVWAGEPNNESFSIPLLTVGKNTKEDLICQLNRAGGGIVKDNLDDLFHGQSTNLSFGRSAGEQHVEVPLVKNTNNIRIILQQVTGKPLSVKDFTFTLTDKNGKMNYDNTLMEDEVLTYQPWHTGDGNVKLDDEQYEVVEGVTQINVAIAELTVARLVVEEEPILTITRNEDQKVVLRIPLVDCALLFKREELSKKYNMSDQEYLDREDEYNLTFFLDEHDNWVNSTIIINDWKCIYQESELE